MGELLGSLSQRARIAVIAALALLVVAGVAVVALTTRSGGDEPARAQDTPGQAAAEAEQDVEANVDDVELAQTLSVGRVANPGDDFAVMPGRCILPDSSIPKTPCQITSYQDRPTVVLWGDSHAQMYLPALTKEARSERVNLVALIAGSCPPTIAQPTSDGRYAGGCERHNAEALSYVERLDRTGADFKVILGGFWSGYRLGYSRLHESDPADEAAAQAAYDPYLKQMVELFASGTEPLFRTLGDLGVATDVLGQAATVLPGSAPCAAGELPYQCDLPRERALYDEADQREWISSMMSELSGTPRYIDPSDAYCDEEVCHAKIGSVNTFFDDIHLGRSLTGSLASYFEPSVSDLTGG